MYIRTYWRIYTGEYIGTYIHCYFSIFYQCNILIQIKGHPAKVGMFVAASYKSHMYGFSVVVFLVGGAGGGAASV